MPAHHGLTIGRLASSSGVNLETIRYYERIGLMPEPGRSQGGHRLYQDAHQRGLRFIRRSRDLGFGIDAIRALLGLAEPGRRSCGEVRTIAEAHLLGVRARIADLVRLECVLAETVARCGAPGATPCCPVLEVLEKPA
jgi:MerR family mercuric resistance operon transcriptional regulator